MLFIDTISRTATLVNISQLVMTTLITTLDMEHGHLFRLDYERFRTL